MSRVSDYQRLSAVRRESRNRECILLRRQRRQLTVVFQRISAGFDPHGGPLVRSGYLQNYYEII